MDACINKEVDSMTVNYQFMCAYCTWYNDLFMGKQHDIKTQALITWFTKAHQIKADSQGAYNLNPMDPQQALNFVDCCWNLDNLMLN